MTEPTVLDEGLAELAALTPVELIETDENPPEPPADHECGHVEEDQAVAPLGLLAAGPVRSQNGYPASADRASIGVRNFRVPGAEHIILPLRADIAPLILEYFRWWHVTIEPLVTGWCWGHHYRVISGTSVVSNHGSGTAGDANAPKHPLGTRTLTPAQRAACSAKARSLGLRSGVDYDRPDEMHAEVIAALARALQLVAALQTPPTPTPVPVPPPVPSPPAGRATLRRGSKGELVRQLQSHLNRNYPAYSKLATDGDFGPRTEAVVKEFQRRSRLVADGIVGPRTWRALGY